jgi:TolB-like protein
MASPATDVFLSYKAEDRSRLVPLVEALEAEGFSVWWDARIGGGTNWHEDIEQHLEAAKCVVVAWTKRSIGHDGHFVRDEARRAQKRDAYIPVCLDGVEPPLGFGEIQALPLKNWKGDRADPRFQALADAVRSHVSGGPISHSYAHFREPRVTRRGAIAGGIGVGAIAVAGVGGWLLLRPGAANANRIAVLPFANLSGAEDQAYFAEGIAEELRSALSRIGLQVIGRASSDAVKELDTKSAASKLDVANILTGSVRRSPQMVRINAQLVDGKDGVERWAQSYDRAPGDTIKIQTDIAENVAQALSIALGQAGTAAIMLGGTADSVAQDLVLQSRKLGREADSVDDLRRRIALAEAAITRDPNYADAHIEKANSLNGLAVQYASDPADLANELAQANAAARKAVMLAPRLGSAHAAVANIAQGRLDFSNSLRETRVSLALSPQDADVVGAAAITLAYFGATDESVQLADRAIALDPLNARLYRRKCEALIWLRRYPEAIEAGRKATALAPDRRGSHIYVGDALLLLGKHALAKAEYDALAGDDPFRMARLALLAARTGDRPAAEAPMAQLRQQYGVTYSYQYGQIYAQLGDADRAFAQFDNAIAAKDSGLVYFKGDPFLDPIRGDPRYAALLKKLNFPS